MGVCVSLGGDDELAREAVEGAAHVPLPLLHPLLPHGEPLDRQRHASRALTTQRAAVMAGSLDLGTLVLVTAEARQKHENHPS